MGETRVAILCKDEMTVRSHIFLDFEKPVEYAGYHASGRFPCSHHMREPSLAASPVEIVISIV